MSQDFKIPQIEDSVTAILREIGEDVEREGLVDTPRRVAKSWGFLTRGYGQSAQAVIGSAIFNEPFDDMVIVRNI